MRNITHGEWYTKKSTENGFVASFYDPTQEIQIGSKYQIESPNGNIEFQVTEVIERRNHDGEFKDKRNAENSFVVCNFERVQP